MDGKDLDPEQLVEKVKEYVNVRKELTILNAVNKGSQLLAGLITDGLVLILAVLAFLFGSLALGFYLSELLGNSYAGFLIVAGIYLLAALILNSIKEKVVEKKIINGIIEKFFRDR
ncbi:MAG: phage holin family protein [Pedobacter sp.]|jgi:hypothetical protein